MRSAFLLGLVVLATACGSKKPPPDTSTKLGPLVAEPYREADKQGQLLKCYLLGKDSNDPVRLCGEGIPSPDNLHYLINAVTPAEGKFSGEGPVKPPGWYLLSQIGTNRVDAWFLGRLGDHQWLGNGKAMLAVDTDDKGTTHVRIIDPQGHVDRTFDVPLAKSEGYVTVREDNDAALLLIQRLGVELIILVHAPLTNPYVETLDVPNSKSPGAKKLWRRGNEARSQHQPFKMDSVIASNFSWKGEDPLFEGGALGPFEDPNERKKAKKPAPQ